MSARALIKKLLKTTWFTPGSAHRILMGPLRGLTYRFSEHSGFAALYSGTERGNQRVYAEVVRPGDVVIDAGANWGVHALFLARLTGPSGRVHAFEPHPAVVEDLRWNMAANGFHQVTIHQCGLYDQEGTIPFVLGDDSKTSHVAGGTDDVPDSRRVEVPVETLDGFVAKEGLDRLRLLKIDVEGAEGAVLRGAKATIQRFKPHLVVELHSPEQDLEVARTLTSWGYTLERVSGPPLLHLDRPWPEPNGVWGTLHATPH